MVKRWKQAIKDTDTILHLGDLFFGHPDDFEEIAAELPGQKYLILGNHDKRKWDYGALGFTVIKPFTINYRGWKVSFNHYPQILDPELKRIHVHGHIHNNPYAHGEVSRPSNINASVEVMDYRPHRISRLLNNEIRRHNQKQRYYNSKGYRTRR